MGCKISFLIVFAVLSMAGLVACEHHDDTPAPQKQEQPAPAPAPAPAHGNNGDQGKPQEPNTPPGPESNEKDEAARTAFAKTLASGEHKWLMPEARIDFVKKDIRGKITEQWKASCKGEGPVYLRGGFPEVAFGIGKFDCGADHQPAELTRLFLITHRLAYSASYIPAFPTEPNQFRLDLSEGPNPILKISQQKSLNALVKDRQVFFDFYGERREPIFGEGTVYFLMAAITQSEDGRSEMLKVDYTYEEDRSESVSIVFAAPLVRQ